MLKTRLVIIITTILFNNVNCLIEKSDGDIHGHGHYDEDLQGYEGADERDQEYHQPNVYSSDYPNTHYTTKTKKKFLPKSRRLISSFNSPGSIGGISGNSLPDGYSAAATTSIRSDDLLASAGTNHGSGYGHSGGHGGHSGGHGGGHGGHGGHSGGHSSGHGHSSGGHGGGGGYDRGGHEGYGGGGGGGGWGWSSGGGGGGYGGGGYSDKGGYSDEKGYGGGGEGHGHGGGHGGGGHGHGDSVNSSAVGLLAFLSLLSLIQNVLRQMTTTMMMMPMSGGGKNIQKRSIPEKFQDEQTKNQTIELIRDGETMEQRITRKMLPLLNAIAQAQDRKVRVKCTLIEICMANRVLVKELKDFGRGVGQMLTKAIGKMLKEVDPRNANLIVKLVNTSAKSGRSGEVCEKVYKSCPELNEAGNIYLPTIKSLSKLN